MVDEHENQQIGDGSDDYLGAARNAEQAMKGFGRQGAENTAGNTASTTQGAGATGNAVSQKGLETGANLAMQNSAAGGAAAQAGSSVGANAAAQGAEATANAAAAAVKAGAEAGKAVAEIATGTAAGGPWGAAIMAAWSLRHTLFKILMIICLILMFLTTMVVSLLSVIFNYIFRTDPDSVGTAASYNIHEIFSEVSVAVAETVIAGYDYAFEKVERIIAEGGFDHALSMQALTDHGATSAEYDIAFVLAAYSVSMEQRGATRQDMINKLIAVKSEMFPVTYEVRETTIIIPPEDDDGEPTTEIIRYIAATIHPFDQGVILRAFQVDVSAQYNEFNITNGEAITHMANALRLTLLGSIDGGTIPPISDAEINAFLENLDVSQVRKDIIHASLSIVGRVPYFWGGKSPPGWNNSWNTPRLVTALGSNSTGTIRPFGLDCSGFTTWVFQTALGVYIGSGTSNQWSRSTPITREELLPGDLGFLAPPGGALNANHVLIYAGTDADGNMLWVHSSSGSGGVVLNTPSYQVPHFRRPNGIDWED